MFKIISIFLISMLSLELNAAASTPAVPGTTVTTAPERTEKPEHRPGHHRHGQHARFHRTNTPPERSKTTP